MTALESDNVFHKWIEGNIVSKFDGLPDIYIQVTVPNEFKRFGKFNIGITAGIETTVAPKDWIDGCNQMDLIIATSNFSKDVLLSTVYDERNKTTNELTNQHKITGIIVDEDTQEIKEEEENKPKKTENKNYIFYMFCAIIVILLILLKIKKLSNNF